MSHDQPHQPLPTHQTPEESATLLKSLDTVAHFVAKRIAARKTVSRNTNASFDDGMTFGQRLADKVASFGGSWTFILLFTGFLALWALGNLALRGEAFDPYPFIFLNLILSMLAAVQAPIIMMSQNRQSQKDRLDAAHDYEVNLKAEIEIMALHEKLDRLRDEDLRALLNEQKRQIEALAELVSRFSERR